MAYYRTAVQHASYDAMWTPSQWLRKGNGTKRKFRKWTEPNLRNIINWNETKSIKIGGINLSEKLCSLHPVITHIHTHISLKSSEPHWDFRFVVHISPLHSPHMKKNKAEI